MASEDVLERAERGLRLDGYSMGPGAMWLIEALAAEVRELRRDKARLDWLDMNVYISEDLGDESDLWRDAIDAAMGGEPQND